MVTFHLTGDALWERMNRAVEKIQERLERTATVLEAAGIPYAIIGGNAVRAWVAQVDEAAVRTTRDVDILLRRADFPRAIEAMERAGFVYRHVKSIDVFLDGPESKAATRSTCSSPAKWSDRTIRHRHPMSGNRSRFKSTTSCNSSLSFE